MASLTSINFFSDYDPGVKIFSSHYNISLYETLESVLGFSGVSPAFNLLINSWHLILSTVCISLLNTIQTSLKLENMFDFLKEVYNFYEHLNFIYRHIIPNDFCLFGWLLS